MKKIGVLLCAILLVTGCSNQDDTQALEDRIEQLEAQLAQQEIDEQSQDDIKIEVDESEPDEQKELSAKTYVGSEVEKALEGELSSQTYADFIAASLKLETADYLMQDSNLLGFKELPDHYIAVDDEIFNERVHIYNKDNKIELDNITFKYNQEQSTYEAYFSDGYLFGPLVQKSVFINEELINMLEDEIVDTSGVKADCFDCSSRELEYYNETGEYLTIPDNRRYNVEDYTLTIGTELFDCLDTPIMAPGIIEHILPSESDANSYTAIFYFDPHNDYPYSISLTVPNTFPELRIGDMLMVYTVPTEVHDEYTGIIVGDLEYFEFLDEFEMQMWFN